MRSNAVNTNFQIHGSFICAEGEEDLGTCTDDDGAPLICPIIGGKQEQYYQAGIVSWNLKCGAHEVPGIYVNVAAFRTWIDNQIAAA